MGFGMIIIGDEILSGRRTDKHLPKVIELLSARGLSLDWADYIGDDRERITATLKRAFASGDIVFSTGGIGATPDDHTRQCAAAALGVPLELHPEAAELIRARIRETAGDKPVDLDLPENLHRLNMGTFPKGASIIPNSYNRIPGFSAGNIHFVPGFRHGMADDRVGAGQQIRGPASRNALCRAFSAGLRVAGIAYYAADGINRKRLRGSAGLQPAKRR